MLTAVKLLKDWQRFFIFLWEKQMLTSVTHLSLPPLRYTKTNEDGQNECMKSCLCFGCNQISHWYPFDVASKPAVYQCYRVFTWLQIASLSRTLHVMGCRVTSHRTIKHRCLHAATFTWSHVMRNSDIRQNNSLCSTVPHPGQFSAVLIIQPKSRRKPEMGSAVIQCQLLAVRLRNVTPSHWKCPVNGRCPFEWSFCLCLCLMMDWGLPLQI